MSPVKIVIIVISSLVITASIAAAVILVGQSQDIRSRAQTPTGGGGGSCPVPLAVSNVFMQFPACDSAGQCDLTKANCSWDAYPNATSYRLKITEVDSNTMVKDESVSASTTTDTFPVTANKTYRCEVAAVNQCGTGPYGSDQIICSVQGTILPTPSPSPAPSLSPRPSPSPTVAPSAVPTPQPLTCGALGCAGGTVSCGTGLICVQANNGSSYCALPQYANACQQSPSNAACCSAPVTQASPKPIPSTLPPSGIADDRNFLLIVGLGLLGIPILTFGFTKFRNAMKK